MQETINSVLFDLDGTITDSGPGIFHCVRIALEQLGHPCDDPVLLRKFVGPPLTDIFPLFGITPDKVDEAVAIYREHYNAGGLFENYPYEGIEQFLGRLRKSGHKLYVATSKPEPLAIKILDKFGLSQYFDVIGGATFDHSRQNKDDVIRYLLDRIAQLENENGTTDGSGTVTMVGDTIYDVEGAAHLNIPCIGVTWGYGDRQQMIDGGAIGIADTMDELYQLILDHENGKL